MNLKDFLVNSARLFPDKTAVIFREKRLTYGELYRDTCICGSALRNMGVKKGGHHGYIEQHHEPLRCQLLLADRAHRTDTRRGHPGQEGLRPRWTA